MKASFQRIITLTKRNVIEIIRDPLSLIFLPPLFFYFQPHILQFDLFFVVLYTPCNYEVDGLFGDKLLRNSYQRTRKLKSSLSSTKSCGSVYLGRVAIRKY